MAPKRPAAWDSIDLTTGSPPPTSSKRQRVSASGSNIHSKHKAAHPTSKYKQHRDSGVGKDFHSVPYPLTLLPKKSWESLTNGDADAKTICSQCGKERVASTHQRKLFLVAERLSWELNATSRRQREQNEISTWAVNAELDIFDPVVQEEDIVIGGRKSRANEWYPYQSREEAELAMMIVVKADILSERTWKVWKEVIDRQLKRLHEEEQNLEGKRKTLNEVSPNSKLLSTRRSPPGKKGKTAVDPSSSLPTPPSTSAFDEITEPKSEPPPCSYRSLQSFYSLLDQIERTLPMGARYLEAYAEQLHKEGK